MYAEGFATDDKGGIYANLKTQKKQLFVLQSEQESRSSSSPLLHHSLHTPLHLYMACDTKV